MITLEEGLINTCLLPLLSAAAIDLKASANTFIRNSMVHDLVWRKCS
jgi:hypothetical protein